MHRRIAKRRTKKFSLTAVRRSGGRPAVAAVAGGGMVAFYLKGRGASAAGARYSSAAVNKILRRGLPVAELEALRSSLRVPAVALAGLLGISKATLHRLKSRKLLGPGESDRIVRYARLMGRAAEVFESEDAGRAWMKSPQPGLGGETPLDFARTELGAREVEDLLGRIEFGVYS